MEKTSFYKITIGELENFKKKIEVYSSMTRDNTQSKILYLIVNPKNGIEYLITRKHIDSHSGEEQKVLQTRSLVAAVTVYNKLS